MNTTKISKTNQAPEKNIEDDIIFSQALANKSYVANTDDIEVTVWPEFLDSKSNAVGDIFIWAYHIKISNKSSDTIQLLNRHWRIIDEQGVVQEVEGEGVVGEQPIIASGGSYQYSSGVHLRYPSGIMTGKYQMQKILSDKIFDVTIPTFSLDVPTIKNVIN
jgi:ApaG protein